MLALKVQIIAEFDYSDCHVYGLVMQSFLYPLQILSGRASRSMSALKLLKSSREHFSKRFTQSRSSHKHSQSIVEQSSIDLDVGLKTPETVYYKSGLVDILSAIVNLDLQLFCHSLGSRYINTH